jgi:hypothetical protein
MGVRRLFAEAWLERRSEDSDARRAAEDEPEATHNASNNAYKIALVALIIAVFSLIVPLMGIFAERGPLLTVEPAAPPSTGRP